MGNTELSKQLCKIGGPFVLLVCFPFLLFVSYDITQKDIRAGLPVSNKWIFEIAIWNLAFFLIGAISTYKGYEDKFRK